MKCPLLSRGYFKITNSIQMSCFSHQGCPWVIISANVSHSTLWLFSYSFTPPGGQAHKRRRTSEPIEIEDRLESLICRVGEKVKINVVLTSTVLSCLTLIKIVQMLNSLICLYRVHHPWRATWRASQACWRLTFRTTKTKSCAFYVLCKFIPVLTLFTVEMIRVCVVVFHWVVFW